MKSKLILSVLMYFILASFVFAAKIPTPKGMETTNKELGIGGSIGHGLQSGGVGVVDLFGEYRLADSPLSGRGGIYINFTGTYAAYAKGYYNATLSEVNLFSPAKLLGFVGGGLAGQSSMDGVLITAIGLNMLFNQHPLGIFLEFWPNFILRGGFEAHLPLSLGATYYF